AGTRKRKGARSWTKCIDTGSEQVAVPSRPHVIVDKQGKIVQVKASLCTDHTTLISQYAISKNFPHEEDPRQGLAPEPPHSSMVPPEN
ncbi:unnamed protein product, partial [Mycena citricolor]